MTALMEGKRGLIMGVANDHSIAWGIAKTLAAHGASLAFTYQGEALGRRVKPLAESIGSNFVMPCDVEDIASVDAVFAEIEKQWGGLDFYVHAIGFSDKSELKGPLRRHIAGEFQPHHGDLVLLVHREREARRKADAERRRDADPDVQRRRAHDAELQRDGACQGRARSLGALSRGRLRARHASASMRSRPGRSARSRAPGSGTRGPCSPSSRGTRRWGAGSRWKSSVARRSICYPTCPRRTTGEIHFVDSGYNVISMPHPEALRADAGKNGE